MGTEAVMGRVFFKDGRRGCEPGNASSLWKIERARNGKGKHNLVMSGLEVLN